MSHFSLRIQKPFSQQVIPIEWISVTAPNGNLVIGPGHRPLVSGIAPGTQVVYKAAGAEHALEVPEGGGLVHVTGPLVLLFLS